MGIQGVFDSIVRTLSKRYGDDDYWSDEDEFLADQRDVSDDGAIAPDEDTLDAGSDVEGSAEVETEQESVEGTSSNANNLPETLSTGDEVGLQEEKSAVPMKVGSDVELFDSLDIEWAPSEIDQIFAAFDASQPADRPKNLSGRETELGALLSGILYRRNHAIIAGPRGSGKTSLARALGYLAEKQGTNVIYTSCGVETPFGQLFRELLEQVPYALIPAERANVYEQRVADFSPESNASEAVKALSLLEYSQLILIIDEFDRVEDETMLASMAAVMKLISDRRLPVRLLLSGSERTFESIIEQHASLIRNLTEVVTNPLPEEEVGDLLDTCAAGCEMYFAEESKTLIAEVSCGSPYHARLFGMQAALSARRKETRYITKPDVIVGLAKSFEEWAAFNREDARIFRNIVSGWHGSPKEFCAVAKAIAGGKVGETPLERHAKLEDNRPKSRQNAVAAFGTALKEEGQGFVFRDSTAPQFLLALQHAKLGSNTGKPWGEQKVSEDV